MDIVIDSCVSQVPEGSKPIPNQFNFYSNILTCLGYPLHQLPVADLLKQVHHLQGQWCVVSPIHWQATHIDAMILAAEDDLQLTGETGRAFFDVFAEFVAPEKINSFYHDPTTWLIQVDNHPPIHARPVGSILHQSLRSEIEKLDATLFWQRFLTEIQMFLSQHPLNQLQSKSNRLTINGVWIWGNQGLLTKPGKRRVVMDDVTIPSFLSTNGCVYSSTQRYSRDALLIFDGQIDLTAVERIYQHRTTNWFWNNQAYRLKPKSWLKRFAENIHAH